LALGVVLLILVGVLIARSWGRSPFVTQKPPQPAKVTEFPSSPVIAEGRFAEFKEIATSFKPQVIAQKPKEDLSNIENAADFEWLMKNNKELLFKNHFVVTKGWEDEFFPLYESNRYSFIPSFITTDSVFHTYHLLFNSLLEKLEKNKFNSVAQKMSLEMLRASQAIYQNLKGTTWENAAKRNIGFFTVAAKLLDENFQVPDLVKEPVEKELELIEKHQGIAISPLVAMGVFDEGGQIIDPNLIPNPTEREAFKEDYTQYIPRGHYDKSDLLKKYFKAMMWYGRITFRFKNDDEIKSAVLMNLALTKNSEAFASWEAINETINFFVGKSDDVDHYLFKKEMDEVYEKSPDEKNLIDENKFSTLKSSLKKLAPPAINSIPIYRPDIQQDREKEIKGFRFMGQKFTMDASIFQRLVCREVGTKSGSMDCGGGVPNSRMLPKGLDIPAAFGSEEAYQILRNEGEMEYKQYPENMETLRSYLSSVKVPIWTQNLYWGWLYSLRPLTEKRKEGYPTFMQTSAWLRKQLNTFLGSWTELKHDTILYAKQVYAEMGAGGPEKRDDRGYVEPEPEVYARLAALTKMTKEGLTFRNLITGQDSEVLGIMEELCLNLKVIAEKELNNQKLADKDYDFIRGYGGSLEHLYLKAMEDNCKDKNARQCLDDNPAALIADVATDPNGSVLEEAIGKIYQIHVIVPIEGKLRIAKGGVYSHYEFPWPMNDRLTDSKWREMLANDKDVPPLPSWTREFLGK
jgi:hypothetical protein